MRKSLLLAIIAIPLICLISIGIYNLPPVEARLAPRLDQVRTRIAYALNPPEEAVFVPHEQSTEVITSSPTPSPTFTPTVTLTPL